MRYILNNNGYIEAIAFGSAIICNNNSCTEYVGTIPNGYSSLTEWSENAHIQAYKIEDGNLVYDSVRDAELQEQWAREETACKPENYSTEEQVIGSYLNKPLYRRTIILNNITLSSNSDGTIYEMVIEDMSNYNKVFIEKIYCEVASRADTTNIFKFFDSNVDGSGNYFKFIGFINNLLVQTNYLPYIKNADITINYTKTTD
jgi:hypothetical protein